MGADTDPDLVTAAPRSRRRERRYRKAARTEKPYPGESRRIRAHIRRQLREGMDPDDVANELIRTGQDPEWARDIVERVDLALEQGSRLPSLSGHQRRGRRNRGSDEDERELLARQATTVFAIGILGLVVCSLLAPAAWMTGNRYLERCHELGVTPSESASIGRTLGMVGTGLLGLVVAGFALTVCGTL